MKKLFCILFLLFSVGVLKAQTNKSMVTINGNVTGDTQGYNQVYFYNGSVSLDSVPISNGKFVITLPFSTAFTELLFTQYERKKGNGGYRPFPVLIAEPGTININMKIDEGFYHSIVSGSQTAEVYYSFLKQENEAFKKINAGMQKMYGSSSGFIKARSSHGDPDPKSISRDSLTKLYIGAVIQNFIMENPDSYVGAYILNGIGKSQLTPSQFANDFNLLSPAIRQSPEGQRIAAYIDGLKNAVVGKQVKNFVLENAAGKPFNFNLLKGKYVWIDFWASWCGPCKAAFPHMQEIYKKYKGDNLEILGISTDETKAPWLSAVNKIKNPWPQIWDNKAVANQFAVAAYPTSFLISPDGKIILKEVGFEAGGKMEKKLEDIFGK
jgi:thiol-disulfide isomerase/thioredoxin